jgi:hypothetical protein
MEHCTSQDTIRENLRRAGKFVTRLGHLASLTAAGVRAWRQARLGEVSRKTVNLEMDTLRQLLDLCQRFGWRDDNPAWTLGKLPWKPSRLPRALTVTQIDTPLQAAQVLGQGAPPLSRASQCYRMVWRGSFSGSGAGKSSTSSGVIRTAARSSSKAKRFPSAGPGSRKIGRHASSPTLASSARSSWSSARRRTRATSSAPTADRRRRFDADALTKIVGRLLTPIHPELTLHCLRHTFATWRLLMGDPLLQVQY